ncbi:MAG: hypothetical protein ABIP58_01260 [Dehalococcoidia bacterium]
MTRRMQLRVEGLPPKKDGAKSMWGKPLEAHRIRALRLTVAEKLAGAPPFARNIEIDLECHVGPRNDRNTGDLDNFLTGICDGLMAADARATIAPIFEEAIDPGIAVGIVDDAQVIKITARKVITDEPQHYYLTIEGS